jgi:sarcosine oxidase
VEVFDVIVAGLGGMGSAAAAHLSQRGQRVLGLDRFQPLHTNGSSHGASRIIRQAYFEGPAYVPLLLRSYELWRRMERDAARELLTVTGGLMIGGEDSSVLRGSMESARLHALPHEVLDAAEIRRRYPTFVPAWDEIALFEPEAGFVHPERAIIAHRERALRTGAVLRFEEPVVSWDASPDRVSVTTSHGRYEAGALVVAAGAWASSLMHTLLLPLTVERQVVAWFEPARDRESFEPGRLPIWIWEVGAATQLYGFPLQDGRVKAAFYHGGTSADPDAVPRTVQPEETDRIRRALAPRIPALDVPAADATTCLYTSTPDYQFVIDRHPDHSNVVVLSPCSGHGFKFVPVVGEIAADLVLDGATRHPIEPFRIGRLTS